MSEEVDDIIKEAIKEREMAVSKDNNKPVVQENQVVQKDIADIIMDRNITADILREGQKKDTIIRVSADEVFQKKSAKIEAGRQLNEAELEAEVRAHELTAENLTKEQQEAAEYYNYHTVVLNFIGIKKALSVNAMKFFYYFALPFFCVISIIRILFNAIEDIVEKTIDMLMTLYVKFMEFIEKAFSSTSKALKALGVFVVVIVFCGAGLLVIYIVCQIIGFDIFGIIRNAINGG